MLEHLIEVILPPIIALTELIGIFVVVVAVTKAFFHYLITLLGIRGKHYAVKIELANGMATGLEFKMAAEILKTVQVRNLQELLVLGAIILLRALLSFMIHVEMKNGPEETDGETKPCPAAQQKPDAAAPKGGEA